MSERFLVDTDNWISFLNKRESAIDLILKLKKQGEIFSSILTITELRAGWTDKMADHFLPIFYAHTEIMDVSQKIAELAGKFLKDYKAKGISLPTVDTLIAATAVINGYQLATRNKKDYPMRELKLYSF